MARFQGAIDMAKAELQYGDNQWAKQMAQKVITVQEQENRRYAGPARRAGASAGGGG